MLLPKDPGELRDLFVEAEHYGLPELRQRVLAKRKVAQLLSVLGSAGNPFDLAASGLQRLRSVALLGATGLASTMALLQQLKDTKAPRSILILLMRDS